MTEFEITRLKNAEEDLVKLCTEEFAGKDIMDADPEELAIVQRVLKYMHAQNQLLIQMANTIDLIEVKLDRLATTKEKS